MNLAYLSAPTAASNSKMRAAMRQREKIRRRTERHAVKIDRLAPSSTRDGGRHEGRYGQRGGSRVGSKAGAWRRQTSNHWKDASSLSTGRRRLGNGGGKYGQDDNEWEASFEGDESEWCESNSGGQAIVEGGDDYHEDHNHAHYQSDHLYSDEYYEADNFDGGWVETEPREVLSERDGEVDYGGSGNEEEDFEEHRDNDEWYDEEPSEDDYHKAAAGNGRTNRLSDAWDRVEGLPMDGISHCPFPGCGKSIDNAKVKGYARHYYEHTLDLLDQLEETTEELILKEEAYEDDRIVADKEFAELRDALDYAESMLEEVMDDAISDQPEGGDSGIDDEDYDNESGWERAARSGKGRRIILEKLKAERQARREAEAEVEALQVDLQQRENENSEARSGGSSDDAGNGSEGELLKELKVTRLERDSLKDERNGLKKEVEQLKGAIEAYVQQSATIQGETRARWAQLGSERDTLREQSQALGAQVQRLRDEKEELEAAQEDLLGEVEYLRSQVEKQMGLGDDDESVHSAGHPHVKEEERADGRGRVEGWVAGQRQSDGSRETTDGDQDLERIPFDEDSDVVGHNTSTRTTNGQLVTDVEGQDLAEWHPGTHGDDKLAWEEDADSTNYTDDASYEGLLHDFDESYNRVNAQQPDSDSLGELDTEWGEAQPARAGSVNDNKESAKASLAARLLKLRKQVNDDWDDGQAL